MKAILTKIIRITEIKGVYEMKSTMAESRKRNHIEIECEQSSSKVMKVEKDPIQDSKAPDQWKEVFKNLREMRKDFDAPVDSMGCEQCMDQDASPEEKRYQTLIALMLSPQTKDQTTHAVMNKLKTYGCTIDKILEVSDQKLGELIHPVGFWKTKVKHIKKSTEILKEKFNGDIPNTIKDLCSLPGVGPKIAHLCMQVAWKTVAGIGVDTHVHRIANRLNWVKTKTPEKTRKSLESWLPVEHWKEINHLLVGFGQQICKPLQPQCDICLNKNLCPYGKKNKKKTVSV